MKLTERNAVSESGLKCLEGIENVLTDERNGLLSLVTEELVRCIGRKVCSHRRFLIGDETSICYEAPKIKQQSLELRHTGFPKPKKA
ncbi:hypothetical protein CEXT_292341 [Caerostris extrusa]|uniref:Uncharacterized protein n=1 Tax=Caerostris extrusa TaxID=172846 RepID=A0AAV4SNY0_CAEEX|nr:hypothetical protein CEXT_292341 [Caerostris extrusa]